MYTSFGKKMHISFAFITGSDAFMNYFDELQTK